MRCAFFTLNCVCHWGRMLHKDRLYLYWKELCDKGKEDHFLTVPHLLSVDLNSTPQLPALSAISHKDLCGTDTNDNPSLHTHTYICIYKLICLEKPQCIERTKNKKKKQCWGLMSLSDLFIISLWVCVGMSSFTHCQMDREVSPLQITACHLCLQSLHLSESLYSSSLSPGSHAVTLNRLPCWFTQSMSSSIKVSQSRTMCVLNHRGRHWCGSTFPSSICLNLYK